MTDKHLAELVAAQERLASYVWRGTVRVILHARPSQEEHLRQLRETMLERIRKRFIDPDRLEKEIRQVEELHELLQKGSDETYDFRLSVVPAEGHVWELDGGEDRRSKVVYTNAYTDSGPTGLRPDQGNPCVNRTRHMNAWLFDDIPWLFHLNRILPKFREVDVEEDPSGCRVTLEGNVLGVSDGPGSARWSGSLFPLAEKAILHFSRSETLPFPDRVELFTEGKLSREATVEGGSGGWPAVIRIEDLAGDERAASAIITVGQVEMPAEVDFEALSAWPPGACIQKFDWKATEEGQTYGPVG